MNWPELWHRLITTKYTAMLEDEVDRLREENRGLLNSLLTRAGVQPIDVKPMPRVGRRLSRNQRQVQIEREYYVKGTQAGRGTSQARDTGFAGGDA